MAGWKVFLAVYLFGGITFPLLIIASIYYIVFKGEFFTSSNDSQGIKSIDENGVDISVQPLLAKEEKISIDDAQETDENSGKLKKIDTMMSYNVDPDLKAGAFDEKTGVSVYKKGWICVTKQCYYHAKAIPKESLDSPEYPLISKLNRSKNSYFCILKHGNLFLYKDEPTQGLTNAIVLKNSIITIWPNNNLITENSVFTNKTCIAIFKKTLYDSETNKIQLPSSNLVSNSMFFLYFDNNSIKEDWYFALLNASKYLPPTPLSNLIDTTITPTPISIEAPNTAHFKTKDMIKMVQIINSSEAQLSTKWLNVILGRLFLTFKENNKLADILEKKIYAKLAKVDTPFFVDDMEISHLDPGDVAPIFTNPKTNKIGVEGDCEVSVDVLYSGNITCQISTRANLNFIGFKKNTTVPLKLKMTLKNLNGTIKIFMKKPPSNRFWYCFENEPEMDLEIAPVVSNRNLNYNMITNAIKSKVKESFKDSLVYPNMDDIVYYTLEEHKDFFFKGGAWDFTENVHTKKATVAGEGKNANDGDDNDDDDDDDAGEKKENQLDSENQDGAPQTYLSHQKKNSNGQVELPTSINERQKNTSPVRGSMMSRINPDIGNSFDAKKNEEINISGANILSPPGIAFHEDEIVSMDSKNLTGSEGKEFKGKTLEKIDSIKSLFKNNKDSSDAQTDSLDSQSIKSTNKYSKKIGNWVKQVKENIVADFESTNNTSDSKKFTSNTPVELDKSAQAEAKTAAAAAFFEKDLITTHPTIAETAFKLSTTAEPAHPIPEMISNRRVKKSTVFTEQTSNGPSTESEETTSTQRKPSNPADMFVKKKDQLSKSNPNSLNRHTPSNIGNSINSTLRATKTVNVNGHEQNLNETNRPAPPPLPSR